MWGSARAWTWSLVGLIGWLCWCFMALLTHFMSFWAWTVNLATLFLGKPLRQFASTKCQWVSQTRTNIHLPYLPQLMPWALKKVKKGVFIRNQPFFLHFDHLIMLCTILMLLQNFSENKTKKHTSGQVV